MKKINSILKTIVAVAIVFVMTQSCVPAGGNQTPNDPTKGTLSIGFRRYHMISIAPNLITGTFTLEFYNSQTNNLISSSTVNYTPISATNNSALPRTFNNLTPGDYYLRVKNIHGEYRSFFVSDWSNPDSTSGFTIRAGQITSNNPILVLDPFE